MKMTVPSRTAWRAAWYRAVHQVVDDPKVFDDPLALRIIGCDAPSIEQEDTSETAPYVRAFIAARSRYVEDELAAAIQRGVRRYVVLGAGLDTFAYRIFPLLGG